MFRCTASACHMKTMVPSMESGPRPAHISTNNTPKLRSGVHLRRFKRYRFLVFWTILNAGIFFHTYNQYKDSPEYFYLRSILGAGLCVSRASATMIVASCCLVLLPKCHLTHSILCSCVAVVPAGRTALLLWLQHSKTVHIIAGLTILISSVIHSVAHGLNAVSFSQFYDEEHIEVNWAAYRGEHPCRIVFRSLAGISGAGMLVLLLAIIATSSRSVRRSSFNVFWYTHHMAYLFLLLFLVHPFSGVLKEEVTCSDGELSCTTAKLPNATHTRARSETIRFRPIRSHGYLWVALSAAIYLLGHLSRLERRNRTISCVLHARHMADAILLTIAAPRPGFSVKPGQFVLLHCPRVSRSEWHPFTVILCPKPCSSQTCFQVLVRSCGDWTARMYGLEFPPVTPMVLYSYPPPSPIRISVDGPFHSPMEGLLDAKFAVCIAGGIGITPFMAALAHFMHDTKAGPLGMRLVWVVRQPQHMQWCEPLLLAFHNKCWLFNQPDRFTFNIYVTRRVKQQQLYLRRNTVLLSRVHFGRPRWRQLFSQWSQEWRHQSHTTHVFTCGPKMLTKEISNISQELKHFHFVHESFS